MRQETTTVNNRTRAYINLTRTPLEQELGQTAHVVETQVPVMQHARLPKLRTPPMASDQFTNYKNTFQNQIFITDFLGSPFCVLFLCLLFGLPGSTKNL